MLMDLGLGNPVQKVINAKGIARPCRQRRGEWLYPEHKRIVTNAINKNMTCHAFKGEGYGFYYREHSLPPAQRTTVTSIRRVVVPGIC